MLDGGDDDNDDDKKDDAKKSDDRKPARRCRPRNIHITYNDELVLRVVHRTYRHEGKPSYCSLREVAKALKLTVPAVTACLRQAWEKGWIRIMPVRPSELVQIAELEKALRDRFKLKDVHLVPGCPEMLGHDLDIERRRSLHTEVLTLMVEKVADILDRAVLEAVRSDSDLDVAVSWGRSLNVFADFLHETPRPARWDRLRVQPALGPTWTEQTDPVEAIHIAARVASAYSGVHTQFPAPAFVPVDQLVKWLSLPQIQGVRESLRHPNILITSMGVIPAASELADANVSNDPGMREEMLADARKAEAIGEINYAAFRADGAMAQTSYRPLGLWLEDLQNMSRNLNNSIVLMCGGDRHRLDALKVALEHKFANVLVSCTVTARYLLGIRQPILAEGC